MTVTDAGDNGDWQANPTGMLPPGWSGEPRVIIFFIPLIWPVGIPDNEHYWIHLHDPVEWSKLGQRNFVGLRIWRPPHTQVLPLSIALDASKLAASRVGKSDDPDTDPDRDRVKIPQLQQEGSGTVVEASTPLILGPDRNIRLAVSSAFDRCIEQLAKLLRAYQTIQVDLHLRIPTRLTVFPSIPMATQDLDERWSGVELFMPNSGFATIPRFPDDLQGVDLDRMRIILS